MPTVYIEGKPYEVKAGKNLLEASLALGFDLPYFCWHPALGSVGACRQCAIKVFKDENDKQGRLIMSCMEGVKDGLHFSISDATAKAFREQVIEWLMTNHPHDCPVCDEGGSCHLQDMTVMTGHDYRRYEYKKRTYRNQYLGPFIHHEMNRCIQCYRCVRYYHDYAGGDDLNVFAAHNHVYFGREKDGVLESPFSGNVAEVCPTGVFTDNTLKEHYTRKWDLTMAPSVCQHCSVGCNTIAGERYGEVRCVLNRYNGEVNGYFLCDRGRFGYEFVNSENRVKQPVIRSRTIEAVDEPGLMEHLQSLIGHSKLIGIGSPRASMETNFALRQLVGADNFYQGVSEDEAYVTRKVISILQAGTVHSASLRDIEQSDAVLILGEDVWNTAPMMALAVRQSVVKTAASEASQQLKLPVWQDAAIKEFVQDDKGLLVNITLTPTPLDTVATDALQLAPDDIARLGFAIAHELNDASPVVPKADDALLTRARIIGNALKQAKKPVIISGISCYKESIIKAAFNIAASLNTAERKAAIAYVVPECNSMGLAMLQAPAFPHAVTRVERESGFTVIVVENNLYRNIPSAIVDSFFEKCSNKIVLDSVHTRTTEKADVLIPAATFAEADGTMVNYEGRAQRFYQVFVPTNPYLKESWRWLGEMELLRLQMKNGHDLHPDRLLEKLENACSQFKGISKVAPPHQYTIHGERIPREPHRYSGRTAMQANINVSEPKPLQDDDSPLTFTMEGYRGMPPSSAIPFFWAPGWNSVQSVAKYQDEPGGHLRGGDPGVKLFADKTGAESTLFKEIPEAFQPRAQKWLLLPQYHVLGSGELSSYTKGIAALSPDPLVTISSVDAQQLGLNNGDRLRIGIDNAAYTLPVVLSNELCAGVLLVSAGLAGIEAFGWGTWAKIEKVNVPINAEQ
jgi:NADH-quinone oxidoreductase subunit G